MDNSQPEDRSLKCKYITVQEAKMLADLLFVPVLFVLMLSPFLVLFLPADYLAPRTNRMADQILFYSFVLCN
jgi:hypothetical protein